MSKVLAISICIKIEIDSLYFQRLDLVRYYVSFEKLNKTSQKSPESLV